MAWQRDMSWRGEGVSFGRWLEIQEVRIGGSEKALYRML